MSTRVKVGAAAVVAAIVLVITGPTVSAGDKQKDVGAGDQKPGSGDEKAGGGDEKSGGGGGGSHRDDGGGGGDGPDDLWEWGGSLLRCPGDVRPADEPPAGSVGDVIVVGDAIRRATARTCLLL